MPLLYPLLSVTDLTSLFIFLLLFLLSGQPLQKVQSPVVSNRIGMKFARFVPQVNRHRLKESNFWWRHIFKTVAMTSARRSLLHYIAYLSTTRWFNSPGFKLFQNKWCDSWYKLQCTSTQPDEALRMGMTKNVVCPSVCLSVCRPNAVRCCARTIVSQLPIHFFRHFGFSHKTQ